MDIEFNKREDQNKLKLSEINRLLTEIKKGGGEKRLQKLRDEGKMTARERIEYLLDKNSDSIEIGAFAGYEMYEEHGGCPSGGVVVVMGYVSGKQCLVVANDASVSDYWKEKSESTGNSHGKQTSNNLSCRFCRSLSSDAGRNFP